MFVVKFIVAGFFSNPEYCLMMPSKRTGHVFHPVMPFHFWFLFWNFSAFAFHCFLVNFLFAIVLSRVPTFVMGWRNL